MEVVDAGAFRHDIKYALRVLARQRGVTIIAVLTLALGIGANSAIDIVRASFWLFRPRLPRIPRTCAQLRDDGGVPLRRVRAVGRRYAGTYPAARVSATLFDVLGTAPALGRAFTREDDEGRRPVAIISDGLWRRKFGGDPAIVGRSILLDRRTFTVLGIMPRGFTFPDRDP